MWFDTGVAFVHDAQKVARIFRIGGQRFIDVLDSDYGEYVRIQKVEGGIGSITLEGTARDFHIGNNTVAGLMFKTSNAVRWVINSGGTFYPNSNGVLEIGGTGNRIKRIHLHEGTLAAPSLAVGVSNMGLWKSANNYIKYTRAGVDYGGLLGSMYSTSVYRSGNQTINNNTLTAVSWTHERYDMGNMWVGGNPTRLTAPVAGKYLVTASFRFASWGGTAGKRIYAALMMNGGFTGCFVEDSCDSAFAGVSKSLSVIIQLTAGQYMELKVLQDSGAGRTLYGSANYIGMQMKWIGEAT